CQHYYSAPNSF
nr:immunoglobulin light chain junction region [Macaca mulatta]